MARLGRSAGLTGLAEVLREAGFDADEIAFEAGVPAEALDDPDMTVPADAMRRLVDLAAERSGLDDLGLRMAERRRLSNWGIIGLAVRDQPTLRGALEVITRYMWLQTESYVVVVEEYEDTAVVRINAPTWWASRQVSELAVGVLYRNLSMLLGESWKPVDISFVHEPPKRLETHHRILGRTPLFNQDFLGFVLRRSDLERPLSTADPDMARQSTEVLEAVASARSLSLRDRVQRELVMALPSGHCSADWMAARLGLDRRTLHRRLAAQATSFTDLLEAVRGELAPALLGAQERPLASVAQDLGFSGASSFAHWHRRRFGNSPTDHRAALAHRAVADDLSG